MMWLSADCVMPSFAAARVKLRSRATARNTRISLRLSRAMRIVLEMWDPDHAADACLPSVHEFYRVMRPSIHEWGS
jgi:hypothetical protein